MIFRWRLPIAIVAVAVIIAAVFMTDSAFSQTDGTGGTGPVEPTPTAVPTPVPTLEPATLVALGQINVKLTAIQATLAQVQAEQSVMRGEIQSSTNAANRLDAHLATWPTEAEWDALLAEWALTTTQGQEALSLLEQVGGFWMSFLPPENVTLPPATVGICNQCTVGVP